MNFLAHLYLSGNHIDIMIGNFIADQVKGNRIAQFNENIKKGITLHRHIDTFTDAHQIVRKSKRRLHERYGHYDGVIIDVFYDHFLAKKWSDYSAIPLNVFAQNVYALFENRLHELPEKTQQLLPYMKAQDWLTSYASLSGIEDVLKGINRRTKNRSQMHLAMQDLKELNTILEQDFIAFFKDLKKFTTDKLNNIEAF